MNSVENDEGQTQRRLRAAFVALLLLLVLLFAWTGSKPETAQQQASTELERWLGEIKETLQHEPCRFHDPMKRRAEMKLVKEELETWESRSKLAPEQLLLSARRLQSTLSCDARPNPSLAQARMRFLRRFESQFRTHYALFRRAEKSNDRKALARTAQALQHLVRFHDGPLRDTLNRKVRSIAD